MIVVYRWMITLTVVAVVAAVSAGPAWSVTPPGVGSAPPALGAAPAPSETTEQRSLCAVPTRIGRTASAAASLLNLSAAWQFSRGAGQTVAVIDTGVTPHARLPRLRAGGDYVSRGDGLSDCDAHGTVVAGIIAATTSLTDSYGGVAPEATILSIRQSSGAFAVRSGNRSDEPTTGAGVGTVRTLASAVTRAVELGATVVNISEVACTQSPGSLNDSALGAAIKYAFDHDVVVVAAAGNLSSNGACRQQNPTPTPGREWDSVVTVASPAWFAPYVLTVGAVDSDTGAPSGFSLHGPWVSVAAPGTDIVGLTSVRRGPQLIDAIVSDAGPTPINGTSFAAPYVAGTVALVRARFPQLSAAQVMARIIATAHSAGSARDDRVGAGVVDPVAALTNSLPDGATAAPTQRRIAAPRAAAEPDPRPRRAALIGSAAALCVVLAVLGLALPHRRVRRLRPDEF